MILGIQKEIHKNKKECKILPGQWVTKTEITYIKFTVDPLDMDTLEQVN